MKPALHRTFNRPISQGQSALDASPAETRQRVHDAIAQRGQQTSTDTDVTELVQQGMPRGFLVMLRRHTSCAESLRAAQQTWSLSARQLEVLACVAAGDANKAIATKLDCTERTVESHVTNLMRATRRRECGGARSAAVGVTPIKRE